VSVPFCRDCAYFRKHRVPGLDKCARFADPVSGGAHNACHVERLEYVGRCKPAGLLFEARPAPAPRRVLFARLWSALR
jgi:hypothetical protein